MLGSEMLVNLFSDALLTVAHVPNPLWVNLRNFIEEGRRSHRLLHPVVQQMEHLFLCLSDVFP
jgi:hypothetical protein